MLPKYEVVKDGIWVSLVNPIGETCEVSERPIMENTLSNCVWLERIADFLNQAVRLGVSYRGYPTDDELEIIVRGACPSRCPMTLLEFFMCVKHPELGWTPTYGGPYHSYTIPEFNFEERHYERGHYDHDKGAWQEMEIVPLVVLHEDGERLAGTMGTEP